MKKSIKLKLKNNFVNSKKKSIRRKYIGGSEYIGADPNIKISDNEYIRLVDEKGMKKFKSNGEIFGISTKYAENFYAFLVKNEKENCRVIGKPSAENLEKLIVDYNLLTDGEYYKKKEDKRNRKIRYTVKDRKVGDRYIHEYVSFFDLEKTIAEDRESIQKYLLNKYNFQCTKLISLDHFDTYWNKLFNQYVGKSFVSDLDRASFIGCLPYEILDKDYINFFTYPNYYLETCKNNFLITESHEKYNIYNLATKLVDNDISIKNDIEDIIKNINIYDYNINKIQNIILNFDDKYFQIHQDGELMKIIKDFASLIKRFYFYNIKKKDFINYFVKNIRRRQPLLIPNSDIEEELNKPLLVLLFPYLFCKENILYISYKGLEELFKEIIKVIDYMKESEIFKIGSFQQVSELSKYINELNQYITGFLDIEEKYLYNDKEKAESYINYYPEEYRKKINQLFGKNKNLKRDKFYLIEILFNYGFIIDPIDQQPSPKTGGGRWTWSWPWSQKLPSPGVEEIVKNPVLQNDLDNKTISVPKDVSLTKDLDIKKKPIREYMEEKRLLEKDGKVRYHKNIFKDDIPSHDQRLRISTQFKFCRAMYIYRILFNLRDEDKDKINKLNPKLVEKKKTINSYIYKIIMYIKENLQYDNPFKNTDTASMLVDDKLYSLIIRDYSEEASFAFESMGSESAAPASDPAPPEWLVQQRAEWSRVDACTSACTSTCAATCSQQAAGGTAAPASGSDTEQYFEKIKDYIRSTINKNIPETNKVPETNESVRTSSPEQMEGPTPEPVCKQVSRYDVDEDGRAHKKYIEQFFPIGKTEFANLDFPTDDENKFFSELNKYNEPERSDNEPTGEKSIDEDPNIIRDISFIKGYLNMELLEQAKKDKMHIGENLFNIKYEDIQLRIEKILILYYFSKENRNVIRNKNKIFYWIKVYLPQVYAIITNSHFQAGVTIMCKLLYILYEICHTAIHSFHLIAAGSKAAGWATLKFGVASAGSIIKIHHGGTWSIAILNWFIPSLVAIPIAVIPMWLVILVSGLSVFGITMLSRHIVHMFQHDKVDPKFLTSQFDKYLIYKNDEPKDKILVLDKPADEKPADEKQSKEGGTFKKKKRYLKQSKKKKKLFK